MSRPTACEAVQQSDQKYCDRCALVWDMNDPDPPECKTDGELQVEKNNRELAKLRKLIL